MENTKQIVQEMREELLNHFKYLREFGEVCETEQLESLTNSMLNIYSVLSNDNNNMEMELYRFNGASINGVLKEERGESIEKPLDHGEGGQGQTPKDLPKWTIFEVSVNKKEPGAIAISFDEDVAERIGTKKVEEYSNEIVDILDRISKDL